MNLWTVLGIVLAVLLAVSLFGGAGMMGFGGFGMGPGMMGGGFGMRGFGNGVGFTPLGAVLGFVFWGLIFGGLVLIIVGAARQNGSHRAGDGGRALAILKERYARGELTRERYEQIRRDLE